MSYDATTPDPQLSMLMFGVFVGIFIGAWLHKHFVSNKILERLEELDEMDEWEPTKSKHKRQPYIKMYWDEEE